MAENQPVMPGACRKAWESSKKAGIWRFIRSYAGQRFIEKSSHR
jgi:hypothetical protein